MKLIAVCGVSVHQDGGQRAGGGLEGGGRAALGRGAGPAGLLKESCKMTVNGVMGRSGWA